MKLSPHSSLVRVKTETCFTSWENQSKGHTLAVNNDQPHIINNPTIFSATAPLGDGFLQIQSAHRERERERESMANVPER